MNKIVRDYSIIIYRAHHYKYLDRICTLSFIQTGSLQFWEHGSANFDFKTRNSKIIQTTSPLAKDDSNLQLPSCFSH